MISMRDCWGQVNIPMVRVGWMVLRGGREKRVRSRIWRKR